MRRKISLIILCTNLLAFSVGAFVSYILVKRSDIPSDRMDYDKIGKVGSLEISALLGSVKSSQALAEKFDDCVAKTSILDENTSTRKIVSNDCLYKMLFWQQIDRENGGVYGLSILFNNLIYRDDCASLARAKFLGKILSDKYKNGYSDFHWAAMANEKFSRLCK